MDRHPFPNPQTQSCTKKTHKKATTMTIGRPTQPIELKRMKGTLRPDRLPPAEALLPMTNTDTPPKPQHPLGELGMAFWNLAWASPWLSHSSDYWLVLLTAQAVDEREQLKIALAEGPLDRKLRTSLRELDKQITNAYSLMGFTPSDRSRLGVSEVKRESKLDELLRKKAERT